MKLPVPISAPPTPEAPVAPVQAPTRSDAVVEPTLKADVPVDVVTMGDSSALHASVTNGVTLAATERAVRLNSLAQEVRAGSYRPNPSQLAERILAEAELEARLRQMVK